MIDVQITLSACPRNHFYRTGRSLIEGGPFGFRFRCISQGDHLDDVADEFNGPAVASIRPAWGHDDLVDQVSQDLAGFISD